MKGILLSRFARMKKFIPSAKRVFCQMDWMPKLGAREIDYSTTRENVPKMIINLIKCNIASQIILQKECCYGTLT